MYSKEVAIEKAKKFVEQIMALGIPIEKAFCFGSYAKNEMREDSDIDVVLVSPVFSGFGYEDRQKFSKINIQKQFVDIETKTYSSIYFQQGDPFIQEILSTGINLMESEVSNNK